MKKRHFNLRLVATSAALLMGFLSLGAAGCGGGGEDAISTNTPVVDPLTPAATRGRYRDLEYVLTLPRTEFSVTDDISWTLAVTNVGDQPVTLTASSRVIEMYSIYKGEEEVQSSSPPVSGAIGREDFAPGQTRSYVRRLATLNQPTIMPGRFTLTAWFAAGRYNGDGISGSNGYDSRGTLSPPPIEFTIK